MRAAPDKRIPLQPIRYVYSTRVPDAVVHVVSVWQPGRLHVIALCGNALRGRNRWGRYAPRAAFLKPERRMCATCQGLLDQWRQGGVHDAEDG